MRCSPIIHNSKTKNAPKDVFILLVAGVGFEPHDLQVMSLTSYQTAPPRDKTEPYYILLRVFVKLFFLKNLFLLFLKIFSFFLFFFNEIFLKKFIIFNLFFEKEIIFFLFALLFFQFDT